MDSASLYCYLNGSLHHNCFLFQEKPDKYSEGFNRFEVLEIVISFSDGKLLTVCSYDVTYAF